MITFQKHWFKIGNEYHLLIDAYGYHCSSCAIPRKKFRVYTEEGAESIVRTNKIVKENDVLEYFKMHFKREDVELV